MDSAGEPSAIMTLIDPVRIENLRFPDFPEEKFFGPELIVINKLSVA